MDCEVELTKTNRLQVARVFQKNKRVDYSIDCVIEGQMGKAFVDNLADPAAYRITVGPFWYCAGEAHSPGGYEMMRNFPAYALLMPSPADWLEVAKEIFGERLQPFTRYSFVPDRISTHHLEHLLDQSLYRDLLVPLSTELATQLIEQPASYLEISDFDSVQDFIERGMGFVIVDQAQVIGPPIPL